MTTSSQLPNYSTSLSDVGIIAQDIGSISIDLTTPSISGTMYSTTNSYTYTTASTGMVTGTYNVADTITISDLTSYQFNWGDAQEFVDAFPDWERTQDMCSKYPGLEIALRNFQTVYQLVKDDYDNPTPKK